MTTPTTVAARVAAEVTAVGEHILADLAALAALSAEQLDRPDPRRADLALEERCTSLLTAEGSPFAGAGLVVAPRVLADAAYWLEWWTADQRSTPVRCAKLTAETDPRAVGFRDYTELPWFDVPATTGRAHVTGPYVDYLCTDQYTLTFTAPVRVGGRFVGVAGADVLVSWFEDHLFDALGAGGTGPVVAVVNAAGRVVTSSSPDLVTGDLVRGLPLAQWLAGEPAEHGSWAFTPCPGLPLGVVTRP